MKKSWLETDTIVEPEVPAEGRIIRVTAEKDDRRLTCWSVRNFDLAPEQTRGISERLRLDVTSRRQPPVTFAGSYRYQLQPLDSLVGPDEHGEPLRHNLLVHAGLVAPQLDC